MGVTGFPSSAVVSWNATGVVFITEVVWRVATVLLVAPASTQQALVQVIAVDRVVVIRVTPSTGVVLSNQVVLLVHGRCYSSDDYPLGDEIFSGDVYHHFRKNSLIGVGLTQAKGTVSSLLSYEGEFVSEHGET
jgi:hypothetical protein